MEIPKLQKISNKPKILLLSDDMMSFSGIGTMSKTFMLNTLDKFDWVQLACALDHPNNGKFADISKDVAIETGIEDASVKLYFNSGYGDPNKLRDIIRLEQPDAILHFTDPRFWQWLYSMEHEIHNEFKIPIMYYAIWDDFPYPLWNKGSYASCDLIMGISRQSHLIHQKVLEYAGVKTYDIDENKNPNWKSGDVLVRYVPHGIDEKHYFPITKSNPKYYEFKKYEKDFKDKYDVEFIFYWTNRNIRRKNPADVIHAFNIFCNTLPADKANKVALLMHTDIADYNGTDLGAVKRAVAPTRKVIFSSNKISFELMNFNYNMSDVTINIASNEGFGLSSAESLMAGTPVINNVTGGLQDQCRFEDENGNWFKPNGKVPSNHTGKYKKCADWAFPVFPSNRSIQGSIPTPYIFDDRVNAIDVAEQMLNAYGLGSVELRRRGRLGHDWVSGNESNMSGKNMGKLMAECIEICLKTFPEPERFELVKLDGYPENFNMGIVDDLKQLKYNSKK